VATYRWWPQGDIACLLSDTRFPSTEAMMCRLVGHAVFTFCPTTILCVPSLALHPGDGDGREGEDPNVLREGVRGALADYEQLFRAQEVNKRMKHKAAHACHALFRARLVEEMRLRKGPSTAEHLKVVLSIIDGPRFP
jgi:hypothetical protein